MFSGRHFSRPIVVHVLTVSFLIAQMSLLVVLTLAQLPYKLSPGQTLERDLKGGQTHTYSVVVGAMEFIEIIIEQRGVNVIVALISPDGQTLAEINRPSGPVGNETLLLFSELGGAHRLIVRAAHQNSPEAHYWIKLSVARSASVTDRTRFAAQQLMMEGDQRAGERGVEKYRAALTESRAVGDERGAADSLAAMGRRYSVMGLQQQALDHWQQAMQGYRELGDRVMEAVALGETAQWLYFSGQSAQAKALFPQALAIHRAVGNTDGEALVLRGQGISNLESGDPQQGREELNQALVLARAQGNRRLESQLLSNLNTGYYLAVTGEFQTALDGYQQVMAIMREQGDRRGEGHTLALSALAHFELGHWREAISGLLEALAIHHEVKDVRSVGWTTHNLGEVYLALGESQRALDYFRQALPIRQQAQDGPGVPYTIFYTGVTLASMGQHRQALAHYGQALTLQQKIGDPDRTGQTLRQMGVAFLKLGEKASALDHLQQALQQARKGGHLDGEARALNQLGAALLDCGEHLRANEYLEEALSLQRRLQTPRGEAETLYQLARLARAGGQLPEAKARLEKAVELVESLRGQLSGNELRASYLASVRDYFELYLDVLQRLHRAEPSRGYDAMALAASERARARALLDLLAEARADIRQGAPALLIERERQLQHAINTKARLTQFLRNTSRHTPAVASEREMAALITTLQQTQAEIRRQSPRYAALTQPQLITLAEIQRQLLDDDTALLEYSLGEERSYLWVVTPDTLTVHELPGRAEIEAQVRTLYDLIKVEETSRLRQSSGTVASAPRNVRPQRQRFSRAAADLSQMILAPATAALNKKRLLIVADGALQYVPFAALPEPEEKKRREGNKENQREGATSRGNSSHAVSPSRRLPVSPFPLIASHEIINLPSASVLATLRRQGAERQPVAKTVAVFADPVFSADDARVKEKLAAKKPSPTSRLTPELLAALGNVRGGGDFARLYASNAEAKAIIATAPPASSRIALGFEANRAAVVSHGLEEYRLIHFATHGLLDEKHPELSGLVFSLVDEKGESQDGFLRLHDIYNLRLNADMVVLSACETGLGREIKGEGLIGLTRGFMYAGAPRVVASLWKVDDDATAELMKRFYDKIMRGHLRPAEALRAAQLEIAKRQQWQSPYFWAAFTLQGDWR